MGIEPLKEILVDDSTCPDSARRVRRILFIAAVLLAAALVGALGTFLIMAWHAVFMDTSVPDAIQNEIVMMPGMSIQATNDVGTLKVSAGRGYKRSYEWEGFERSVKMWPRNERWNDSLGLYYPGPGNHWEDANGIRRAVTEEGWRHFGSSDEAVEWLRQLNEQYNGYNGTKNVNYVVYTNDGLVFNWSKNPGRRQLNVQVWQVLISGKKPQQLLGSQDSAISVDYRKLDE